MVGARIALIVGAGAVAARRQRSASSSASRAALATRLGRRHALGDARHRHRVPGPAARDARRRRAAAPRSGSAIFAIGLAHVRRSSPGSPGSSPSACCRSSTSPRRARAALGWPGIVVPAHPARTSRPRSRGSLALQFGVAVLAEARLSYLGLGAPPPNASWGRMLQEAQGTVLTAPVGALAPGIALVAARHRRQLPRRRAARASPTRRGGERGEPAGGVRTVASAPARRRSSRRVVLGRAPASASASSASPARASR